jgi:tetratricopeptide (TPR) repeat protein
LAENAYSQSIALRDDYELSYYNLGIVQKDMGKTDLALQNYQKAMELKPEEPNYAYIAALTLQELGRF